MGSAGGWRHRGSPAEPPAGLYALLLGIYTISDIFIKDQGVTAEAIWPRNWAQEAM